MRVKNLSKNVIIGVFGQGVTIFAGFLSTRVLNMQLGEQYNGLKGTLDNTISALSVTELGVATAIAFHLYRALVEDDKKQIASLMNLYRKAYYVFAGILTTLGMICLPFIHLVDTKEHAFAPAYIREIFILLLLKTVSGYLLSYKRSIVIADQRDYVSSLVAMVANICNYASIIVLVTWLEDLGIALCAGIVFDVISYLCLICYVDKKYPFLKEYYAVPVDRKLIKKVFGDLKNIVVTRFSTKMLGCTDNLIIAKICGVSVAGLYTNYTYITQAILNLAQSFCSAMQPSFGNLVVDRDSERDHKLIYVMSYIFFLIAAVVMCGVFSIATPFVKDLWLDDTKILPIVSVFLCAVNLMLQIFVLPIGMYLNVSGLFQHEKWITLVSAITNIFVSIVGAFMIGLEGVLLGTLLAYLIQIIGKSIAFFKDQLEMPIRRYAIAIAVYLVLALGEAFTCQRITMMLYGEGGILKFLLCGIICVILPTCVNLLLFCRTKRLHDTLDLVKSFIPRRVKG